MNQKEIMDKMYKIQLKYNNVVKDFHKDKQFIELSKLLKKTKIKRISMNKIIIE